MLWRAMAHMEATGMYVREIWRCFGVKHWMVEFILLFFR
jgi:hypothetical protein